jgi:hypothetical protein
MASLAVSSDFPVSYGKHSAPQESDKMVVMTTEDSDKRLDSWEIVEGILSQLNNRLSNIETRLNHLEAQRERQVVLSEHRSIDSSGLGGREISTDAQGTIQRQILIGKCDTCGRRLFDDEAFKICSSCGKRLCASPSKCSVTLSDGHTVCIRCLKTRVFPLNKSLFRVLISVAKDVGSIDAISKITHLDKRGVADALTMLNRLGLTIRRGILLFASHHILDRGMEAIGSYRQIWGEDYDMLVFGAELRRHLSQRT